MLNIVRKKKEKIPPKNIIVNRERGQGTVGREEEGRECTDLERRGLV